MLFHDLVMPIIFRGGNPYEFLSMPIALKTERKCDLGNAC